MPLKLIPPRVGQSQNWRVRGTYLGFTVDRTAGTPRKELAGKALKKIEREIEEGAFARSGVPTFDSACKGYLSAGGDPTFLRSLIAHFRDKPLTQIGQTQIDEAAATIYPNASQATRNRQVYTPVSAILKSAGVETRFKRPKGSRGNRRLFFLSPEQADKLIDGATAIDAEFGLFCTFLLYTGCRLNEATGLLVDRMNLSEGWAFLAETKNDDPRLVHMPPVLIAALKNHPRGLERAGRVFRFSKCGRLYKWLGDASKRAGVELPGRVAFHVFRHTWGAWMRRYGGLDTTGLVETGAWRSRQAASVYEHAVQSEEARKADLLPVLGKIRVNRLG
jgi:integrase